MPIDWLTVAAQIVNFFILLALLNRFLYRPIVSNMEARRQYIEQRLSEAGQIKAEAERLIASYREKLTALEEERAKLLAEARRAAQEQREALLAQALKEVEAQRRKWQEALAQEQEAQIRALKSVVAEQAVAVARKALRDLAEQDLETRVIESFLRQLSALPDAQRRRLAQSSGEWVVATGFPLDPPTVLRLREALEHLKPGVRARFEQRDELLCGLALEADGQVWRWNLAAYLDELETKLRQAL
ncbi:ATP synthase subunit B [Methylothermus subterraneus]